MEVYRIRSLCTILFWSLYSLLSLCNALISLNHDDRVSLLAFKAGIESDPSQLTSSWNSSSSHCEWPGVSCGRRHRRRVTALDLSSCGLTGQLSPHLGNLSFLRSLNMRNNSFSGHVPPEIGRLFRLRFLDLSTNHLGGEVPANLSRCSDLRYLEMSYNTITGKVPQEIGLSLSKLQVLRFRNNDLFGEMPFSLGNLSSLESINLVQNRFHGSIPHSFGKLKSLKRLNIGVNYLSGTVPPSLYNLSSLEAFNIYMNQLEGSLPPDFGNSLPNIDVLLFHTNNFTGPIPASISNMSIVTDLELSTNHFSGKVPTVGRLTKLQRFVVAWNDLGRNESGDLTFLPSLVNHTDLDYLAISHNNFGGELPQYISNFSRTTTQLVFGSNQIQGSIPIGIGNLINLDALGLEYNQLTGSIPDSICKLQRLYGLTLAGNELSGAMPSCLGNLTSLGILSLSINNLEGKIPPSLGRCIKLNLLEVDQNSLSGSIPKELMGLSSLSQWLSFSENQLTGPIPREVGQLINLENLDLSENKLFGKIPETLGSCTILRSLYLEGNSLEGTIPDSLSYLKGIDKMDLSRNNLSGNIPKYFQGFHFLANLNLSFNDLEGEVPMEGIFKNSSILSILGNKRLCGGIVQLNLTRCLGKHGHSPARKIIISSITCGLGLIILLLASMLLYWKRNNRGNSNIPSSSFTYGISFPKLSFEDLRKATDGFSSENLIGIGGFGSVYKGILNDQDRSVVAVKVLNLQTSTKAVKSFIAECKALRNIRHRNLLKLVSACSSVDFRGNDFKALVYEFMANGSLEQWLHGERHLSLGRRIGIAIDVANALDYLHNHCFAPIVHCDLKQSNVLLDDDNVAHVGDFGLVRFLSVAHPFSSDGTSSVGLRGSIGYAAPEYGIGSEVSTAGDVYSYGILLLEMFTGKRPTDAMFNDDLNLHEFASMALPERVQEILDPTLFQGGHDEESIETSIFFNNQSQDHQIFRRCLISILEIGVSCSARLPEQRMSIDDVVAELSRVTGALMRTRAKYMMLDVN